MSASSLVADQFLIGQGVGLDQPQQCDQAKALKGERGLWRKEQTTEAAEERGGNDAYARPSLANLLPVDPRTALGRPSVPFLFVVLNELHTGHGRGRAAS